MDTLSLFDEPQPQTSSAPDTGIVPRATVRDMVRRRQRALDLFDHSYTCLSTAAQALTEATAAHLAIDQRGREDRFTHHSKAEEAHFLNGLKVPALADYRETARKMIDRRMWAVIVELTELERLMDKQARDELQKALQENPPEVTEDNIFATLSQFVADADTIFKRGIANCFSALDRRFRSHDSWKIGSRVILSYAFNEWGSWSYHRNHRDTLRDIERTFYVLDGKKNHETYGGIVATIDQTRAGGFRCHQGEHESEYFLIRTFKNGNAHLWFKRKDLVEKVNKLLGEYYGAAIPEERDAKADPLSTPKTTLAKRYGFFPTPDRAAEELMQHVPLYRDPKDAPLRVLEPSAGTGNLARRCLKHGAQVDCVEIHPERAAALRAERHYNSVHCSDFLSVPPRPIYDLVVMNPPFDRERDIDHVVHALRFLKPDGQLHAIMSAGTEFRETAKSVAFRELVVKKAGRFRDLPAGSFSSTGTNVNAAILRLQNDGAHRYW